MSHSPRPRHTPPPAALGPTLAAALRAKLPGLSWSDARRLIAQRHVHVNGTVCLDDARRLTLTDRIDIDENANPGQSPQRRVQIIFRDNDLVVVDKPAGLQTVRRTEEAQWSPERKGRQPVLAEVVADLLKGQRVRPVHRLDRDTSGLMLFALSARAEAELIKRFANHEVHRTYEAVVLGQIQFPKTIDTQFVRDRGDGLRGSVLIPSSGASGEGQGEGLSCRTNDKSPHPNPLPEYLERRQNVEPAHSQRAITHIEPIRPLGQSFTLIRCRLETGRTHQIRIHLSEADHMLAGEKVYLRPTPGAEETSDPSHAPRQALHSVELELAHPLTGKPLHFTSDWPPEMMRWMEGLG